ncbi:MAG TPA: hypothetical protein VL588_05360, partial [Bdellovibrionota bacterium]|nr:hypothetical protein [Bdellovibrionota bacterium]
MTAVSTLPRWMSDERARWDGVLAGLTLPGRKDENYRYSSLQGLDPAASGAMGSVAEGREGTPWAELRAQGVYIADLATASRECSEEVQEALALPAEFGKDPFAV